LRLMDFCKRERGWRDLEAEPLAFGRARLDNFMQRFRGGLVFEADRLLYRSTLGLEVTNKKGPGGAATRVRTRAPRHPAAPPAAARSAERAGFSV